MKTIQLQYRRPQSHSAEDFYTFTVIADLMMDLDIYAIQNSHNTLILDSEQQATIAVLYLSRYTAFDVAIIE